MRDRPGRGSYLAWLALTGLSPGLSPRLLGTYGDAGEWGNRAGLGFANGRRVVAGQRRYWPCTVNSD
ncbi:hypothetical protein MA16_Dca001783 [Dendrobium catenatum]|uniref:Uncharacterized protein n=1 Tax=Dendrobium catenatum TaxID=906689 RepID=A0A2I0XDH4_9ASPA|nr:hypothetical protein MA16_Dca001783 [Dendrobium catenatum]